jgi:tetratricopeptide (TPR) repeat protein
VRTIHCPGCHAPFHVDERRDPRSPFSCPSCRANSTLGAMLSASGEHALPPALQPAPPRPPSQRLAAAPPPAQPPPRPSQRLAAMALPELLPAEPPPARPPSQRLAAAPPPPRPPQAPPPQPARSSALELSEEVEPIVAPKPPSQRLPAAPPPRSSALELSEEVEPTAPQALAVPPESVAPEEESWEEATPEALEAAAAKAKEKAKTAPDGKGEAAAPDRTKLLVGGGLALALTVVVVAVVALSSDSGSKRTLVGGPRGGRTPERETEPEPTPEPAKPEPRPAPKPEPAKTPGPKVDAKALWAQVDAAVEAEDYAGARQKLDALPDALRAKEARRLGELGARLEALGTFKAAAETALTEAEPLLEKDPLAALDRLRAAVPSDGAFDTPTGRRLVAATEAAGKRCLAVGIDPSVPARPLSPERAAALDAAAAAGAKRVEALQARLKQEHAAAAADRSAALEQAKKASLERPLSLEVVPGLKLENAVVTALDDERFALSAGDDDVAFAFDAVKPEVALRVRRLGLREDRAEDLQAHGLWCAGRRLFTEARRAFKKAASLDPKLAAPDVDALEKASRVWNGSFERRGGTIELRYAFDDAVEAKDWASVTGGGRCAVTDKRLVVQGSGVFLVGLAEVGFTHTVDVQATLDRISSDGIGGAVGVSFGAGTEREETWIAVVFPSTGELALARWKARGGLEVVERKAGALRGGKSARVRLVVRGDRLEVLVKGTTVASVRVAPNWEKVRVLAGGAGQASGAVGLSEVVVRGRVRFDWLRKAFGEFEEALAAATARIDELPALRRPEGKAPVRPLTADEPGLLGDVPDAARKAYEAAVALQAKGTDADPRPLVQAHEAFGKLAAKERGHAGAWFRRGAIALRLGWAGLALEDLDRARRALPRFHEAIAARALALAGLGRLADARAAADEALRLAPDAPEAWRALGEARFRSGDLQGALEAYELALALDPWDDEARGLRRNVSHVLSGPPWTQRFRTETKHYRVETNISQKRCEEYAADLEVVRAAYAKRFEEDQGAKSPEKSTVFVFDTEEGYHGYAALTIDDRVESTCGVFLPRYGQLLLFEGKEDQDRSETRQTLFHEGFHQFLHGLVPDAAVPYWLNEGLAEFHSALTVTNGAVTAEAQVLSARLADLRLFLGKQGPIPFERLMKESPAEFYSGAVWAKYAQAWSMVHFFETGAEPDLRERFQRYVAKLRAGDPADAAFTAAWAGVKWPDVQKAWRAHVDGL